MPVEEKETVELLDLKMLPAWVKEAAEPNAYAHYEGEPEGRDRPDRRDRDRQGGRRERGGKRPTPNAQRPTSKSDGRDRRDQRPGRGRPDRDRNRADRRHGRGPDRRESGHRPAQPERAPLQIGIRFVPHPPALDSVTAQIKGDLLAYSVFSLARLFLQKPERYDVHLAAKPESPLFQIGETGAISADRAFLESNAFRLAQNDFYKTENTQTEPVKGNFTSVARHRLSGVLLGPTNHHGYQPRLRSLYEQRFSRRMSFPEFQRQVEIVSDPALVEQWKEESRTVTTFTTLQAEPPVTFNTAADAERHFRVHYLGETIRQVQEATIDGNTSRTLADRYLRRAIEEAWSAQTRSPSQMMAELLARLREAGLNIFRHRKGMLFVSPIRVRPFAHEDTAVSAQVRAIIDTVAANQRINRKDLAEKLLVDVSAEEMENRKLALASDLRWLISEGYVIEFNDGSLDLPRAKAKPAEAAAAAVPAAEPKPEEAVAAAVPAAESSTLKTPPPTEGIEPPAEISESPAEAEIGGS